MIPAKPLPRFAGLSLGGRLARREAIECYLFILPWFLGFLFLKLGPILASLYLSFTQYNVMSPPSWIGVGNFQSLARDPLFWQSLRVTVLFVIMFLPIRLAMSLVLALLLNQKVRGIVFFRTVFYVPSIISGVAVSLLWLWIFNPDYGIINALLSYVGITGPGWLFDETWALPSIVIMSLWGFGDTMLIYLAGLQGVPSDLYEAAAMDGANFWAKFWSITLPMLSPVIFFNLVMGIIQSFQVFTPAYVMTKGGPNNATLFYNLYLYNNAFVFIKMGLGSAMAWILMLIVLVLTIFVFKSSPLWVHYQAGRGK